MHQAKLDRKEALKVAAKERGLTRRAAYGQLVQAQSLGGDIVDAQEATRAEEMIEAQDEKDQD